MSKDMKTILEILEEQVINKTLSLEGIGQVQKIVDENKRLTIENEELKKSKETLRLDNSNLLIKKDEAERKLATANKELSEYKTKDKDFYEQGVKFEYEAKRGDELKEILGMALRNTTIRQTMFGGQTHENGMYGSKDETVTREED